jgi:hypothetical protein
MATKASVVSFHVPAANAYLPVVNTHVGLLLHQFLQFVHEAVPEPHQATLHKTLLARAQLHQQVLQVHRVRRPVSEQLQHVLRPKLCYLQPTVTHGTRFLSRDLVRVQDLQRGYVAAASRQHAVVPPLSVLARVLDADLAPAGVCVSCVIAFDALERCEPVPAHHFTQSVLGMKVVQRLGAAGETAGEAPGVLIRLCDFVYFAQSRR